MTNFKMLALVGALSVAFASPAMAAISAAASTSNFTVTLYDLNPTDGITSSITWTDLYGYNSSYGNYTQAYTYEQVVGYGPTGSSSSYGTLGSVNTSTATLSHASATASVGASSSPLTPSGSLSASGSAYATTTSGQTSFNAYAYEPYYYYSSFVLSANTVAVFKLTASTQATTTVGYDPLASQSEDASAYVQLSISGAGPSGNGGQSTNEGISSSASYTYTYTYDPVNGYVYTYLPQTNSSSATLAGAFVNTSGGDLTGNMYLYAQASGNTNVAAVPEPETYAMFLAGLGIIGAVARRRQSR